MKIWLIDDDSLTNMLNKMLILEHFPSSEIQDFEVAEDAVALLKDRKNWPNVIFLDINMPVMNGWDFLDEIKGMFLPGDTIPKIHMLTSSISPEDKAMSLEYSQVTSYLIKPLELVILTKVLKNE